MTEQRELTQAYGDQSLTHVIVHDETGRVLPTVIIIPTVMGVQPLEIGFAEKLVAFGYHVVIADLFGQRFTPGVDKEVAFAAMGELRADRAALRDRLLAIVGEVRKREHVDASKLAVIGFCFGGQCALDVARSGADVAAVASFHGLFDPCGLPAQPIKAKVVAFHGWDDPMVPPEAVVALGKELTEAGADWQIHAYGHVGHGFTNPNAHQMGIKGVFYHEAAARRSWAAFEDFPGRSVRMTAYVALLRAVNVSGTGKLPMTELKAMGEACGFEQCRTFIASGNLLFVSKLSEAEVERSLEKRVEDFFGRRVPVYVRSAAEMAEAVAKSPFNDDKPSRVMAHFINDEPTKAMLKEARDVQGERMALGPRLIYVSYGGGIGKTKLKLPAVKQGTARNMNSVAKIAELLAGME